MSNVLVTGGSGQLATEFKQQGSTSQYSFIFVDKESLDITNIEAIQQIVKQKNVEIIINCAAYTAVDKAEEEAQLADLINHIGAYNLARVAKNEGIKLIHISTDYVFDGNKKTPYVETDPCLPQGIYGQSKRDGENAIEKINPEGSIIIRTSWMYSTFGHNFFKTMMNLGEIKDQINVVSDQKGTPTWTKDLVDAILDIMPQLDHKDVEIYHYANQGETSWFEFASKIMAFAKLSCKVNPISTQEYPTLAKRPVYSVMNCDKIQKRFNLKIPNWEVALQECIKKYNENRK